MIKLEKNIGPVDRSLRLLAGLVLLAFFALSPSPAHWLGLVGVVPIITAIVRFCPAYTLFGVNTCKTK